MKEHTSFFPQAAGGRHGRVWNLSWVQTGSATQQRAETSAAAAACATVVKGWKTT